MSQNQLNSSSPTSIDHKSSQINQQKSSFKLEDQNENGNDHLCGIGSWRPKWLQICTDPRIFLINFSIVAVIQGAYFTYLIGCSSTLEKRFAYSSRLTGFILIADNFSQIIISPLIGFLGKRMNKATLIAGGMVFVSFSCWLTALPYFIYGPATHLLTGDSSYSSKAHLSSIFGSKSMTNQSIELCGTRSQEYCTESNSQSPTVWPAYVIVWLASFLNGVGYTAFYTLGFPYVDDNVPKHNAPVYFSILSSLRLLGPATGFLLVSLSLSFNEDPFSDHKLEHTDPRFIGAWWLGFIIIGSLIFLSSLPLFLFPKNLKSARPETKQIDPDGEGDKKGFVAKFTEAKKSLLRILKNPVWVLDTCAGTFRFIGYAGFYITQPKYIESQFRKSASSASFATGAYSVMAMAFGIMGGGIFIRLVRPGPRLLTGLIFLVELFANAGIISGLFFGCPKALFYGVDTNLITSCNSICHCSRRVLQPYCSPDGKTNYFSPCFAGCQSSSLNNYKNIPQDCMCSDAGSLSQGFCKVECNNFTNYILFLSIGKFISSTSRTGNYIVRFRSIEERDKSFAMGIGMTVFGTFGSIPYPLIFGAIADAACAIWEEGCGGRGNCWLYDSDKFRVYLHVAAFTFMTIGSTFDVFVIYFSKRMKNLYDDGDDVDGIRDDNEVKKGRLEFKSPSTSSKVNQVNTDTERSESTDLTNDVMTTL